MKAVAIDGKECFVYAERNDEDGGIITCVLVPNGDGSYYSNRTWEGAGAGIAVTELDKRVAQQNALENFARLTAIDIAARAGRASDAGVSGKTHRS